MLSTESIKAMLFGKLDTVLIRECMKTIYLTMCSSYNSKRVTRTVLASKLSTLDNDGRHDTCKGSGLSCCQDCSLCETGCRYYPKIPSKEMCDTLLTVLPGTRGLYEAFLEKKYIAISLYTGTPKDVKMIRIFYKQEGVPKVCVKGVNALSLYRQVMFRIVTKPNIFTTIGSDVEPILNKKIGGGKVN